MIDARVTGCLVAAVKDPRLAGVRLLLAQCADGKTVAAGDILGAGIGCRVLIATGSAARLAVGRPDAPLDAAVVAIVEEAPL